MLVYKDFLIWLLTGWWLYCQPIKSQVLKSLLTNIDFYIGFSQREIKDKSQDKFHAFHTYHEMGFSQITRTQSGTK